MAKQQQHQQHGGSSTNNALLLLAGGAVLLTLVSIFGPTLYLVEQHDAQTLDLVRKQHAANSNNIKQPQPPSPLSVARNNNKGDNVVEDAAAATAVIEDLRDEYRFRATIKSCINNPIDKKQQHCHEYMPEQPQQQDGTKKKKIQRVAILSPPGELMEPVLDLAEMIGYEFDDNNIEIIETTHVPPCKFWYIRVVYVFLFSVFGSVDYPIG